MQHFSYPGNTFAYLRECVIGDFEVKANIKMDEWIHLRAEVAGAVPSPRLCVHADAVGTVCARGKELARKGEGRVGAKAAEPRHARVGGESVPCGECGGRGEVVGVRRRIATGLLCFVSKYFADMCAHQHENAALGSLGARNETPLIPDL